MSDTAGTAVPETAPDSEQPKPGQPIGADDPMPSEPVVVSRAASSSQPAGSEWSDDEKQFRMRYLELSSEGDKQLAFANTAALRTVATEKRLWLKDRKELRTAIQHLENARAAFKTLYAYLEEKGRVAMVLDENGVFKKKAPEEAMTERLGILKGMCLAREEADQSALQAQDIVIEVSTLPGLWNPWEASFVVLHVRRFPCPDFSLQSCQPPIPASVFINKLREARRLCETAKAEYKKIAALERIYPSELVDMHNGRRVMGQNTLETVVLPQLGHEEAKAMHRLCGDQFLEDVDKALRSQLDPMLTSEYCQKLFTAIDVDGSGAIDAEELRGALIQLKVFLTEDEAAAIVTELDVDRRDFIHSRTQNAKSGCYRKGADG